jgi:diaminohydroxyphosphoribosylaminopyrimidine deaminase / 5-amino-6-(5-phosphoribosylamino)uracil reductase
MQQHEVFMQRCTQLAKLGVAGAAPNPMVAAVLVYKGKIIGEGFHQRFGDAHAEVNCINSVAPEYQQYITNSTLYVSLEPCNHQGKTPACSHFIVAQGIKKVVIGCKDSFSKVNGSGISFLKQHGVEVQENILQKSCREVNKAFFTFHEQHRPYIILKWAQTNDGFIANDDGSPIKISNALVDVVMHKLRAEVPAIAIGSQTLVKDNPSLTVRHWHGRHPHRFVLSSKLKLATDAAIWSNHAKTNVLVSQDKNIQEIVLQIQQQNIGSILIEGGTKTLQQFIDANLWDEAYIITNHEMNIQKGISSPILQHAALIQQSKIFNNLLLHYKHENNEFL